MKNFIKIFLLVFILNSCYYNRPDQHDIFIANNTLDSMTVSFDACFVTEKTKKDSTRQQITLAPIATGEDFDSDSSYYLQVQDIKNNLLLPYLLCEPSGRRRNPTDTGHWISKYNTRVRIAYRLESMIALCVCIDTLNDSTAHIRLTIPSYQRFELGTTRKTILSDSYFKNITIGYKDTKDKTLKVKYYENYGQLKKYFQLYGERDSALIVE